MKRIALPLFSILCITAYSSLFFTYEKEHQQTYSDLSPTIPVNILKIASHTYLQELVAEILYIKVAVYYGGLEKEASTQNLDMMVNHFDAMSQLHPQFIDTYYRAESALAYRGSEYAQAVNHILETGRAALPEEVVLPFFEGFNYLNYLGDTLKAGQTLKEASEIAGAPQWIGHLASMLLAGEGNIRSGLALLQGMYASTQDKDEKKRYQQDIETFQQALIVQQALDRYRQQRGFYAKKLQDLIPDYLMQLPDINHHYQLKYTPPRLSLVRRRNNKP